MDKTNDPVEAFVGLPAHRYTPLGNDTPQLRLLRLFPGNFNDPLKGRLSVTALEELERDNSRNASWEALSYCWGRSTMSEPLLISDAVSDTESHTVLNITPSLSFALQHLRLHDRDRVIWIDQTCVNQNDLDERSRQVWHMNIVYKKADKVTVWLGSGDPDSHRYIGMLSIIGDLIRRGLYPRMEKPTHEQEATLFEALTLESAFRNDPAFADTSTHNEKRQSLALLCKAFCRNT